MKWLTIPFEALYRVLYRWETRYILWNFNRTLPKLYLRLARAGYNRAQRRDTLRRIAKGAEVASYGEEI